jgi:hypothetical protein
MSFIGELTGSYASTYKQQLATSRAKEDRDREVRLAAYHARLQQPDVTVAEARDIWNQIGQDTGYKHDPKIFGMIAPHGGYKGMDLGDVLYGPPGGVHDAMPHTQFEQQLQKGMFGDNTAQPPPEQGKAAMEAGAGTQPQSTQLPSPPPTIGNVGTSTMPQPGAAAPSNGNGSSPPPQQPSTPPQQPQAGLPQAPPTIDEVLSQAGLTGGTQIPKRTDATTMGQIQLGYQRASLQQQSEMGARARVAEEMMVPKPLGQPVYDSETNTTHQRVMYGGQAVDVKTEGQPANLAGQYVAAKSRIEVARIRANERTDEWAGRNETALKVAGIKTLAGLEKPTMTEAMTLYAAEHPEAAAAVTDPSQIPKEYLQRGASNIEQRKSLLDSQREANIGLAQARTNSLVQTLAPNLELKQVQILNGQTVALRNEYRDLENKSMQLNDQMAMGLISGQKDTANAQSLLGNYKTRMIEIENDIKTKAAGMPATPSQTPSGRGRGARGVPTTTAPAPPNAEMIQKYRTWLSDPTKGLAKEEIERRVSKYAGTK